MVNPPHQLPDPYEQEWAIRELTQSVRRLTEEAKANALETVANTKAIDRFKTAMAIWSGIIAMAVTVAMRLLFK